MSQSWRTPENRKMITASIQPRHKSQLIPLRLCMDEFTPDMNRLTDAEWMQWFHRMELLARLGVVAQIPELQKQTQTLADMLIAGQGVFKKICVMPTSGTGVRTRALCLKKTGNFRNAVSTI
jgi:hypothetical protein